MNGLFNSQHGIASTPSTENSSNQKPTAPTSYPCVDCGWMTEVFCDGGKSGAYMNCFASERVPADYLFNVRRTRERWGRGEARVAEEGET